MFNFKIVMDSQIGLLGPDMKLVGEMIAEIIYICRDLGTDFHLDRERIVINARYEPSPAHVSELEKREHEFRLRAGRPVAPTPAKYVVVQRTSQLGSRDNTDPSRQSPPARFACM